MTALFGMEHYEVIIVSWLAAATALGVVSAFAFALAFFLIREPRPVAAHHEAAAKTPVTAEPARISASHPATGAPVGAA